MIQDISPQALSKELKDLEAGGFVSHPSYLLDFLKSLTKNLKLTTLVDLVRQVGHLF